MSTIGSSRKTPAAASAPSTGESKPSKPRTIKLESTKSKNRANNESITSSRAVSPSAASQLEDALTAASSQQGDGAATQPEPTTRRCKHCGKQWPIETHPSHSKQCLRDKQEKRRRKEEASQAKERGSKEQDAGGDVKTSGQPAEEPAKAKSNTEPETVAPTNSIKGKKTSVPDAEAPKKQGKKRKADAANIGDSDPPAVKPPTKKQMKKEAKEREAAAAAEAEAKGLPPPPKPKPAPKPKGPVDVEKQCGVITPSGQPCARSLTCKSHAMGAKRAVAGRSLPYDILLQNYQKKNQAKQQKAALAASQQLPEDLALEGSGANGGPVDSDEEKEAVMSAIKRAAPRPLVDQTIISSREKYRHVRMKEMLSNALGGNRGGSLFSTRAAIQQGGGVWNVGEGLSEAQGYARRASSIGGSKNDSNRKSSTSAAGMAV